MLTCLVASAALMTISAAEWEEELRVLPPETGGVEPSQMMRAHLVRRSEEALDRRDEAYEQLKTPEDLAAHRGRMRAFFIDQLGGLPERTPLNARVVGEDPFGGFRVERVVYESLPGYFVPAHCYVPASSAPQPPYPGIVVLCGHQSPGVGKEAYFGQCALLARNGFVVLCIDCIGQGERHQVLTAGGRPRFHSSLEHMHAGVASILVGRNVALYFVWDAIRAVDYLEERDDVNPGRIGCLGGSGGGTQTAYLMALDDRIACASPRNYMTSLRRVVETMGPQDAEQNIHAQISHGMGHGDFILMAMPCAVLMAIGTRDMFDVLGAWDTFREGKRAYARIEMAERIDLFEADAGHGATPEMNAAIVRWFRRWLQGIDDGHVAALDEPLEPDDPMHCTAEGQVVLLEGARSTFDLNVAVEERLAEERRRFWSNAGQEEALGRVRAVTDIRPLDQLPVPESRVVGVVEREGYRIEKLIIEPECGIGLPGLLFVPDEVSGNPTLYVHGAGKHVDAPRSGRIEQLVLQGRRVLAVDLRGLGETQRLGDREDYAEFFGPSYRDASLAYMLGASLLAMRAEDILVCARVLSDLADRDPAPPIELVAIGEAGPPALHAAALEQPLFASVELRQSLVSWSSVVHTTVTQDQWANLVHGALRVYDLPDLLAVLPPDKVVVSEPLDAAGKPTD